MNESLSSYLPLISVWVTPPQISNPQCLPISYLLLTLSYRSKGLLQWISNLRLCIKVLTEWYPFNWDNLISSQDFIKILALKVLGCYFSSHFWGFYKSSFYCNSFTPGKAALINPFLYSISLLFLLFRILQNNFQIQLYYKLLKSKLIKNLIEKWILRI